MKSLTGVTISTWKIAHSQEPSNQLLGFSGGFSYFHIVVHYGWVGGVEIEYVQNVFICDELFCDRYLYFFNLCSTTCAEDNILLLYNAVQK